MISVGILKRKIKLIHNNENIPHETLYQNFFFERFLERLSISEYRSHFILKGGFLITSMLGILERTTNDIDITVAQFPLNKSLISDIIKQIITIDLQDEVNFNITNISDIRHEDKYHGLRLTLCGMFKTLKYHFKLDFSTGDKLTPNAKEQTINLTLSEKNIKLFTYNIETVLAEKIETILSRNIANTRSKDFYDVHSIIVVNSYTINYPLLNQALRNTMSHRGTYNLMQNTDVILTEIEGSNELKENWLKYMNETSYVNQLSFKDVVNSLRAVLEKALNIIK